MISINTNTASSLASYNLNSTNINLQRSLQRLSSGSRINSSFDDAGGTAVSMKLSASIRRTEATQANVGNAIAFLQTQDGVLKNADKVLTRMSELAALAQDVTKSDSDISLYDKEFLSMKEQLLGYFREKFNGISLFSEDEDASGGIISPAAAPSTYFSADQDSETGSTLSVVTSEDGNQAVDITRSALTNDPFMHMMIHGFHRFEIAGETYISRQDINPADFAPGSTVGITAYHIPSGQTSSITGAALAAAGSAPSYDSETGNFNHSFTMTVSIIRGYNSGASDTIEEDGYMQAPQSAGPPPVPQTIATITPADFLALTNVNQQDLDPDNSINYMELSQLAIQSLASMRATNGAEQSRMTFAQDMLAVNKVNLESANSRIVDVDVASESSQLARLNVLQQAGTAMLAQANIANQSILRLIA